MLSPEDPPSFRSTRGDNGSPTGAPSSLTISAGVIHQYDLLQQDGRGSVQHTVHSSQQCGPGLVVKHDDDAGGGQWRAAAELLVDTSRRMEALIQLSRSSGALGVGGPCPQVAITVLCSPMRLGGAAPCSWLTLIFHQPEPLHRS